MTKISVVVPNLNGSEDLAKCLDSLLHQSVKANIVVVDNASTDDSLKILETYDVELIKNDRNYGFAGGVNQGIKRAMSRGDKYVALFNNDAVADKNWLKKLVECLDKNPRAGIVTSKIIGSSGEYLDSTGDFYTTWGLPFPRGRRETDLNKYDDYRRVFAASGGASLYRISMLEKIGLFDEDFFAYYEDVDISFRARLAGWEIYYEPKAVAYHHISATSSRIPGFATQQTIRNLPFLVIKNVPARLLPIVMPRFTLAYLSILLSAIARGKGWSALKGLTQSTLLKPKKLGQRFKIQRSRKLSAKELSALLIHDLPPNAHKLRKIRGWWWKLAGKNR